MSANMVSLLMPLKTSLGVNSSNGCLSTFTSFSTRVTTGVIEGKLDGSEVDGSEVDGSEVDGC